ncbi:MAG TPA: GlsB/YeaQ/YmgE family stress response membrane protein [Xanthobacteraceae bacterium]|nr:GlsB/YeaQ/YmgE family stress response membrane protein [Xanthobacteraceae bacterium]
MNDLEKFLADPVVTLILIILIGAIIGWIYEEYTHSPHGYITSALVGVAGSYTGYYLARLASISSNLGRFLAAAVAAVIVLWAWRTFHLHPRRGKKKR